MSTQRSHALPYTPVLVVQDGPHQFSLPLERNLYTLGRDPLCTITLRSPYVSRLHATLIYRCDEPWDSHGHGYYELIDGDGGEIRSRNGLLVNRHKTQQHTLCLGDEIDLAPDVRLTYTITPSDLNRLVLDEAYWFDVQSESGDRSEHSQALRQLWQRLQQQAPRSASQYVPKENNHHQLPSYETLRLQAYQVPTRPLPLSEVPAADLEASVVCVYPGSFTGEEEEAVIMLDKSAAYQLLQDQDTPP